MGIYRIIYFSENKRHEIYAKSVSQPNLYGFIEIESLVFTANSSCVLIDPAEEKLQNEFSGVKRCFLPISSIIRIDEVDKPGRVKISETKDRNSNVASFPNSYKHSSKIESE